MSSLSLGIYFGSKLITLVETSGKKILNTLQIQRLVCAPLSSNELDEKIPDEVKMVALLKEELRKTKISAKDVTISLSGKDLIIRNFEIPVLPPNELFNAVNFEVKKYIPFKVEDLISDFQTEQDKLNRRIQVLYVGIKKETLNKYISIISQLNMKLNTIEYSAFSVLKLLKLTSSEEKGVMGVMSLDFSEEEEINFTILENGFPLFSRDITLTNKQEEISKTQGVTLGVIFEKLKTEIRISLDYYNRKFPSKKIEKAFFICSGEYRSELETFFKEMVLPVQFIDTSVYTGSAQPYDLSIIKGYGSSLAKVIKTNLKINILAAKEKEFKDKNKASVSVDVKSLFSGFKLDVRFVLVGLVVCGLTFAFGLYRKQPLQKELSSIILLRPQGLTVNTGGSYEELTSAEQEYKKKLGAMDNLITKQPYLTDILDVLPRVLPEDIRLNSFLYTKTNDKIELKLQGAIYLDDSDKEFKLINSFISKLNENRNFRKYFRDIKPLNIEHAQITLNGTEVSGSSFTVHCKN
ncbi:MAG: pilus assembly protein PilM [Candidatus Omnitrophota bacterium]